MYICNYHILYDMYVHVLSFLSFCVTFFKPSPYHLSSRKSLPYGELCGSNHAGDLLQTFSTNRMRTIMIFFCF